MAIDETFEKIVQLAVVLALSLLVVNALFGAGVGQNPGPFERTSDADVVNATGTLDTPRAATIQNYDNTQATLGDAVKLAGTADSYVDIQASASLDGDHEACTLAAADSSAVTNDETRTMLQAEDLVLYYNGTSDRYEAWYYDDATRESAVVSVATTSPTDRTLVCGQVAGSTLTIYRGTTQGTTETLDGDQTTETPPDHNWDGELEETRLYNRTLNASQRSEFNSSRAVAVTGEEAAIRVMYDDKDGQPGTVPAHFADGSVELVNASLTTGVSGPSLTRGSDYEFSGDQARILSGSSLDDSGNVLFVDINGTATSSLVLTVQDGVQSAFTLAPVLLIVILAVAILGQLRSKDR